MATNRPRKINRMPAFIAGVQQRAEATVLRMLIPIGSEAAGMTPRETSNLINSQYREVRSDGTRVTGRVGYTAEYAGFVHDAPGTLLGKDVPRSSGKGVVWGPSGEPEFLIKGAAQAAPIVERVLRDGMAL